MAHLSIAYAHLALKEHPSGKKIRSGGRPSIGSNSAFLSSSNLGTDLSNPMVYGCLGLPYISLAVPLSIIFPAYITFTRSAYLATTPKL